MTEILDNSSNSRDAGDAARSTTDTAGDRATRAKRLMALAAVAAARLSPDVRGNTLRGGEGSQPTDATDDGRGDPVVRAFGAHAFGLIRTVRLSSEQTLPTPEQQPPADS